MATSIGDFLAFLLLTSKFQYSTATAVKPLFQTNKNQHAKLKITMKTNEKLIRQEKKHFQLGLKFLNRGFEKLFITPHSLNH